MQGPPPSTGTRTFAPMITSVCESGPINGLTEIGANCHPDAASSTTNVTTRVAVMRYRNHGARLLCLWLPMDSLLRRLLVPGGGVKGTRGRRGMSGLRGRSVS